MLRRLGADPPFSDPRGHHGVAMEGYYWRFTDPAAGRCVVVLTALTYDGRGDLRAMIGVAGHPGGFVRSASVPAASAARRGLDVRAGDGALRATADMLRVDLGGDCRVEASFAERPGWPARAAFGGIGPAQLVPGLSQYWHPWLLGGRAAVTATLGGEALSVPAARVYAEKNWGAGGMPESWWWGEAHDFPGRDDVCVAFAGGRAGLGPLRVPAGSLVVRLGDRALRVVRPLQRVHVGFPDGRWHLRGRTRGHTIEAEGGAEGAPHLLPVPLPGTDGDYLDARAPQHLAGRVHLRVTRGSATVFAGESPLAGLEHGLGAGPEAGATPSPPA